MSSTESQIHLNLPTVNYRRSRSDMIEVGLFKISHKFNYPEVLNTPCSEKSATALLPITLPNNDIF